MRLTKATVSKNNKTLYFSSDSRLSLVAFARDLPGFMHFETPTVTTLTRIPNGFLGVVETLRAMSRYVKDGKKSIGVRQTAMRLTKSCLQKDYACELETLHAFVRDDVRYVQDIADVETVQTPQKTLEFMAGDCDDKVTLLAALIESIGHKTRFVAIGFSPQIFEHVYLEALLGTRWIPLETTEPVEAGWAPDPRLILAGPYRWHN